MFVDRRAMVADAAGLTAFVAAGTVSHGGAGMLGSAAATLACLLAAWFAVAAVLGAYRTAGRGTARVVAVWAVSVPLAVLVRALLLSRTLNGHEAAFLATSLAFTALFVVAARVIAGLIARSSAPV